MGVNIIRPDSAAQPRTKTRAQLQAELESTEKKLEAAIRSNAMLEECIVEMADILANDFGMPELTEGWTEEG